MIFLDVDLAEAMRRIGSDTGRPLLAANPERRWQELQDERRALYLKVARFVVRTDGRTPSRSRGPSPRPWQWTPNEE